MGMFPGRRRASLFLVLTLLLSVGFTGALAQDAPPDAPPETTATVVPPTATSTLTPTATATLTATATDTPPATTAAPETTDEPAPETTDEPALTATDAPTAAPSATPLPAEPPLALLASDLFEGAAFGNWQPGAGWSLAPAGAGQSARTDGASPLAWAGGPYLNAAVQARFLLPNGGSAVISLRRSAETLAYAAALDASGQVTLYRAGAPVAFATVAPLAPDEWRALRLSAVNAVVRVSVNGVEAIAWGDAAPLPPGAVALAAANLPADGGALADDFGLWVPLSELALYPTPTPPPSATPTATLVPTAVPATPTPAATAEPEATEEAAPATPTSAPELTETVESTAEPEVTSEPEATEETALITPTLAPESTAEPEATSEPESTAEPEATDEPEATSEPTPAVTDEPVGPDGKSLTPNQVDEPVAGLAAAEDLPAGAILIPAIPFSASGTTNRADLGSAGEPAPTCGFNITRTLWYRFVVPAAGPYTVTSAGSAFDTILAAYTDPFSAPAALLGCSDDASPTDLTSRLNLNLTAGQTIYIQLGGYNGFSGPYTLRVQQTNVPLPWPVRQLAPRYAGTLWDSDGVADITFEWAPLSVGTVYEPASYQLQVARSVWFTDLVYDSSGLAGQSAARAFDTPGAYYWRVRGLNVNDQPGAWSAVWLFYVNTAPAAPTLYLPADASVTTLTRPTLIWLPTVGAGGYRVDVSTSSTFSSFALENQPAVANYLVLPAALSQGRYFWRVQAVDAAGSPGPESAAFQLDINIGHTPAPNVAFTTYPTLPTARPTFVWVPQAGATAYTLEIATSETFGASIVYSVEVPVHYHALPLANALSDGVYFWRVRVGGEALPPEVFQRFTVSPPPAPAPVQTGPAYAAQLSSTAPPLTWNPVSAAGGPFTYELQLDRTGWFNSPALLTFTQADGVTAAGFTVPGPLADGAWAWRVRAVNAQGRPGYWSPAYLFYVDTVAPPAPTLYLPANASVTTLTRPTLIWLPAAGASGYRLDVSTDPNFGSFTLENQPAVANYLALPTALSQGRYFWRVQAVDAAGNLSPESAAFQLDINIGHTPAPNAAFTTYPTLPTARPTFVWVPQAGATAYTLEIATSDTFGASIVYSTDLTLYYHVLPVANALPDGVYFWRVRVGGEALPPEVFQRFTVSPPPAPAPVQTGPAYAAQLSSAAPPLAWNPVPPSAAGGPFTYELQLDRTGWFNSPALLTFTQADGVTAAGFTVPGPLADGVWAWRVRAVNAQGRPGYWSPAYLFYVDTVAPPAPTLYLPASNSAVYTRQPAFIWLPTVGAARYEIALSTNPAFTAPLLAPAAWNYYVPTSPLLLTTYSWRVRAFDAAGNVSAWSDTRTLKVESPAYSAPLLNRYTTAPTLTWTPVSWAQAYHLQVAQDAAFTRLVYDNETLAAGALQAAPGTLPNGSYYWRVRARSGAAAWGWWSTPGMFLVDSGS